MALINIDSVLSETRRQLRTITVDAGIELLSYKRDRTITIIAMENGKYCLLEKGFKESKQTVSIDQLEKRLKKLIKFEFPRSRKVRLHTFKDVDKLDRMGQKM